MNISNRFMSMVVTFSTMALLLLSCAPAAAPTAVPQAAPAASKAGTPESKPTAAPATPASTSKPAADQPRPGGILKVAAFQDEATFDLHITGRTLAYEQSSLSYNGVLQYDPEDGDKIIPDLAESYQVSPDGKKITFNLSKNARWHDDKPFTSADVKFNFDRWVKPPEGVVITRKEIVAAWDRVETPDTSTVELYLKYPSASAIPLLAMSPAVILPPQYLKDHKTMEYNIIGTGPYKLKKYTRGVSVEHVKNDSYFVKGRPHLDGVAQYMIPDNSARFAALRTGQVKITFLAMSNITPSQAETIKTQMSDKLSVARILGLGHTMVLANHTRPPFSDPRVRQALDMALDRKKAIDVAEGRAKASAFMPPGPWALLEDELAKRPGYRSVTGDDIAKAKSLLAEAGYPDGFRTVALTTAQYSKQAVFVQDQLKSIGITVTIDTVDQPTLDRRYISAEFEISVYPVTVPINDPDSFLALAVTGGGRNYGKFNDKQIDDWYQEQSRAMEPAKRKEVVLQMQRRILDLAAIPILYTNIVDLPYWKCIRGFYPEKQVGYYNNLRKQDVWLAEGCR